MPWHQEPMKDVVICDNPWGVGKRALIRGSPNRVTSNLRSCVRWPLPECIGKLEGTWGSETSQYSQEKKTIVIPLVVASESGSRLNRICVIADRRCRCGVVGSVLIKLLIGRRVINHWLSGSVLESCGIEGETPVCVSW